LTTIDAVKNTIHTAQAKTTETTMIETPVDLERKAGGRSRKIRETTAETKSMRTLLVAETATIEAPADLEMKAGTKSMRRMTESRAAHEMTAGMKSMRTRADLCLVRWGEGAEHPCPHGW
jgi:hypothetical protein